MSRSKWPFLIIPLWFAILFSATFAGAHDGNPYKIVILAEHGALARAQEVRDYIRGKEPFSRMGNQLEFQIIEANSNKLGCKAGCNGIDGLVCCNSQYASRLGAENDANQTIVLTDAVATRGSGSAGGISSIPVSQPPSATLHELMHGFGLSDEYSYDNDARQYCGLLERWRGGTLSGVNSAFIKPRSSYRSDSEAKQIHSGEIPWFGSVLPSTLITTGDQLGTTPGVFPKDAAALYRGGNCDTVTPTWRPYNEPNIMTHINRDDITPVQRAQILKVIESARGEPLILLRPEDLANGRPSNTDGSGKYYWAPAPAAGGQPLSPPPQKAAPAR